jgi:hypothetical protein
MKLTALAAAFEAAVGVLLIVNPSMVVWLLLGADLAAVGHLVGRLAGIALLALGLACWPGHQPVSRNSAAVRGLLAYNALAAVLFFYVGVRGEFVGLLLWPAVAIHALLAILFARVVVVDFATR